MESITCRYRPLCAVEIYHHYFLDEGTRIFNGLNDLPPARKTQKLAQYAVTDWLQIEPDLATRAALPACHVVYKPTKTGFVLVTKTDGPDQASVNLNRVTFTFYLRWRNPELAARTALPLTPQPGGQASLYVFGNEFSRNNRGVYPGIGLPIATYQNLRTYVPGEIVKSGAQQFVARVKTTGNAPPASAIWRETDPALSYVSFTSLRVRPAAVPPGILGQIQITGRAGLGNFSVLSATNQLKSAQVYQLHLDKF